MQKDKDSSSFLLILVKEDYPLILDQEDPETYHDLLSVMIRHGLVFLLCLAKNINVSITFKYSLFLTCWQ